MATVIVGGGIIGLATAYYLSLERPPSPASNSDIHIIDSSHSLFLSASGFAGGFLAEDWFSPASASLGALSFKLHRDLAKENDGYRKWGYAGTRTYSLSIDDNDIHRHAERPSNGDWLTTGTSRVGVAPRSGDEAGGSGSSTETLNPDGSPRCFTAQPSGRVSIMAEPDTTAQIEPRLLCEFLLTECQSRGVQVHLSATPTSIVTDPSTNQLSGLVYTSLPLGKSTTLSCTNLVLTAGAWTPSVFETLFPGSKFRIPVRPLAGTSLLARSPRYTIPFPYTHASSPCQRDDKMCYAIYSSPMPATFAGHKYSYAPEAFARLGKDSRPEIWIGGLNHPELKLPERAEDVPGIGKERREDVEELKACLVQLCGKARTMQEEDAVDVVKGQRLQVSLNEDDLEILREGLCFRPVSETGVPILGRVEDGRQLGGVETADKGGVFVATGHGPWGISLSLGTGKVMSELVLGQETSADVGRLRVR